MPAATRSAPRSVVERRRAALDLLARSDQLWLATGGERGAHLIPVSYIWNGAYLTMATFLRSRTVSNLRAHPAGRAAVGQPSDLVMVDGAVELVGPASLDTATADAYARISFDPRVLHGLVFLRLVPAQIQVWNGFHEFHGRTIMADGRWLDTPEDPAVNLPDWVSSGP